MRSHNYLCCGAASVLAMLLASNAAHAQSNGPAQGEVEEIVVTGSLILGTPEGAALPVDVISSEELSKQGSPTALEMLKSLPVSSGVLGDSNQFDSRSQGTEGIATVNLRGLGPERTLVLLNSRRLTTLGAGVVDVNLMPSAAIGRVEILKEGAAATYGSDAVAGVVNFITRKNQEGLILAGDYKFISGSEGDYTLSGSYGHRAGPIRVFVAAGWQHRSELLVTDRDFANRSFADNPEGGWSSGGHPSSFLPVTASGTPLGGVRNDSTCAILGGQPAASGSLAAPALNSRCYGHNTPFDALTEEEDRVQLYGELAFEVTPDIDLTFTGLYGKSDVPAWRTSASYLLTQAPSATAMPTGFSATAPAGFFVPASNPGYQLYLQQNPGAVPATAGGAIFPLLLFRPYLSGGNPLFMDENAYGSSLGKRGSESKRLTAEMKGKLTASLNFDLAATYHSYTRTSGGQDAYGDRVQLALRGLGGAGCNPALATPGQNGCLYLNPFGNSAALNPTIGQPNPFFDPSVANTAELTRWMFADTASRIESELFVLEGAISGDTGFELPGGAVAFAVGAQYRKTKLETQLDDANNLLITPCRDTPINGNMACNPATGALGFLGSNRPQTFEGDVYAVFTEFQVPVTDDLNLQLAARYEEYGTGASTFDPKITARYQALPWLALRGSYGTTFRGPPDQYVSDTTATSLQLIGSSFKPVEISGNPNLKPESAVNTSVGIVIDAGQLSLNLDYYRTKLKGQIVSEPVGGMVTALFGTSGTANCAAPDYQALRQRFLFNDGAGVPGAGTCSLANVTRVRTDYINGSGAVISGIDLQAQYRGIDFADGQLSVGGTATRALGYELDEQLVEGIVVQKGFDAAGKLNMQTTAYPLPKWKAQAYLEYQRDIFDARLTINYIGGYSDQRSRIFQPRVELIGLTPDAAQPDGEKIESYVTADLSLRAQLDNGTTLSFTVINLTNEEPSFVRLNYNYDPFTGNPLLRQFKVGVSHRF